MCEEAKVFWATAGLILAPLLQDQKFQKFDQIGQVWPVLTLILRGDL